jgi:hypothetical protein
MLLQKPEQAPRGACLHASSTNAINVSTGKLDKLETQTFHRIFILIYHIDKLY